MTRAATMSDIGRTVAESFRHRRMPLIACCVALFALTALAFWWIQKPGQQLLFGDLREADAAEIVQSLGEWKVPYEITDGGKAIRVPTDRVYETRMRLVSAGIPRGGHVGFELFDDSDFGVTEFAQRVNYQRALQGEIERTIASLPGVENARVHLTIRKPGLFVGDKETSKASVALTLRPGETLTRRQVGGIRSLVAASVEGLAVQSVSVLDASGGLLAGGGDADTSTDLDSRSEEEARYEERVRARITELLEQVLHNGEFRVSADVTMNFDAVREVRDAKALMSAEGTSHQEISRALGRIERMSIAVIVPPDLDEMQLANVRALIAAAAGIDSDRGDRLEVSRLRRDERWGAETASAGSRSDPGKTASVPRGPGADGALSPMHSPWLLLLIATGGMLIGAIVISASTKRPKRLRASERDAVLIKLRGWLAEGELRQ